MTKNDHLKIANEIKAIRDYYSQPLVAGITKKVGAQANEITAALAGNLARIFAEDNANFNAEHFIAAITGARR